MPPSGAGRLCGPDESAPRVICLISNAHRLGTLLLAAVAVTAAGATAQHGTARGLSASAGRPGWRHVTTYRWDKELRQFGDGWDHGRRSWWRFALDPAGKYLWILDSNEQWLVRLSLGGGSPPVTNQAVPSGDGKGKWDLEAISCDEAGLLWVCQVSRGDR